MAEYSFPPCLFPLVIIPFRVLLLVLLLDRLKLTNCCSILVVVSNPRGLSPGSAKHTLLLYYLVVTIRKRIFWFPRYFLIYFFLILIFLIDQKILRRKFAHLPSVTCLVPKCLFALSIVGDREIRETEGMDHCSLVELTLEIWNLWCLVIDYRSQNVLLFYYRIELPKIV